MKLPRIFEHFSPGQIFTIEEAREKLETTGNTLRKRLSELAARGYIIPIRQGLYRLGPSSPTTQIQPISPFALAEKLTPFCYIAYRSALLIHTNQTPPENDVIYIVSPTKFNAFAFEGRNYFWCQSAETTGLEVRTLYCGEIPIHVRVTDFEKTIIDCLRRPAHCPPLTEFMKTCSLVEKGPNISKLMRYVHECKVAALFNRVGFFLEQMKSQWNIPDELLTDIERQISKKQIEWSSLSVAPTAGVAGASQTVPTTLVADGSAAVVLPLVAEASSESFEPLKNRWRVQASLGERRFSENH